MHHVSRCFTALVLTAVGGCASLQLPNVHEELREMHQRDQQVRMIAMRYGMKDTAANRQMRVVDSANTMRLKELVRDHGFLTKAQVGSAGLDATFLIVQHSSDLEFQQRYLPHLVELANRSDIEWQEVALLTDRILVDRGQPQTYGTQLSMDGDRLVPYPINSPDSVDVRRAAIGLPPLQEYIDMLETMMREAKASEGE